MSREGNPARNPGIDAFRFVAVAAVVVLHCLALLPKGSLRVAMLQMACRFAVPFFFVVSGYFLRTAGRPLASLVTVPLMRLLPIYLGAILIYYAVWKLLAIEPWHFSLRDLKNGGPLFHLWFLPALGVSLVAVGLGERLIGLRATMMVAAALAVAGLGLTTYREMIGLPPSQGRSGWLFGPLFLATGMVLARRRPQLPFGSALPMFVASYALVVGEELLFRRASGAPSLVSHDFVFATYPLGVSAFLLALSLGDRPAFHALAAPGRLALGIYVFHLLFLKLLQPAIGIDGAVRLAMLAAVTLAITLGATWLLARIPGARRLVM